MTLPVGAVWAFDGLRKFGCSSKPGPSTTYDIQPPSTGPRIFNPARSLQLFIKICPDLFQQYKAWRAASLISCEIGCQKTLRGAPKRSTSHVLQSLDRRSTIGAKTTRQVSIDNAPSGLVASSNLVNSWGKKTGTGRALCQPIQFATLNSNRFCCWPRQTVTRCSPALNPLMVFENRLEAIFLPSSFKTTSSLSKPYPLSLIRSPSQLQGSRAFDTNVAKKKTSLVTGGEPRRLHLSRQTRA